MDNRTPLQRFNGKVIKHDIGCWEWEGHISEKGYGNFWLDGRWIGAHVASYILHKDAIPKGKQILHKCDNKICTRPSHLYAGTPSDNMCDKYERAIDKFTHKPYKLEDGSDTLDNLKYLYSTGNYTYEELSIISGISKTTVHRSINR